jgi:hypothetical protein
VETTIFINNDGKFEENDYGILNNASINDTNATHANSRKTNATANI